MAFQQHYGASRPSHPAGGNHYNNNNGQRRPGQSGGFPGNPNRGGTGNSNTAGRDNRFRGNREDQGPRKNERIRANEVRVIDPDGSQSVMSASAALLRARDFGLDLVEVAPTTRPPVCRIVDFGKYQYEESKKQRKQKTGVIKLKEVKLRPRCDEHDLMIKIKRAENFLYHGNKIRLTLSFRFRELEHPEVGEELMRRAIQMLAHVGTPDHEPRLAGRSINTTITPVAQAKRKLIYNTAPTPVSDDDDDDDDDDGADETSANSQHRNAPTASTGGSLDNSLPL
jgi:translation initiation factor IF-3